MGTCWSCGSHFRGEAPYRLPLGDFCSRTCYAYPYSVSGKTIPDAWPPLATGRLERIPWPRPDLPWLDALTNRDGRIVRSKIDAQSARQTLAEMVYGADEADAIKVSGAALRYLEGDDPSKSTLRTAADEALAKDAWGSRGHHPGSADHGRGLFTTTSLDGIDPDTFRGGAGVPLERAAPEPCDEWDEVAHLGDPPSDEEYEQSQHPSDRPPSDAARDRAMATEAQAMEAGFEMLAEGDPADDRPAGRRGPVSVADVAVEWTDSVFDTVWEWPRLIELVCLANGKEEFRLRGWSWRGDDDAQAICGVIFRLEDRLRDALWAEVSRPTRRAGLRDPRAARYFEAFGGDEPRLSLDAVAKRYGTDTTSVATVYRWAAAAREQVAADPVIREVVGRWRAERRPANEDTWLDYEHRVTRPRRIPLADESPHWAWTTTAPMFHFTKIFSQVPPDMRKIESLPAPTEMGGQAEACPSCTDASAASDLCSDCYGDLRRFAEDRRAAAADVAFDEWRRVTRRAS